MYISCFSGRRNPLRMLSNAIDFRTRRKQRPKSADFESVEETDGKASSAQRSASVTDILETVNPSSAPLKVGNRLPPRVLEGRNSAPDILPTGSKEATRPRVRTNKMSAALHAKQKLSTRFQPQRKPAHRSSAHPISVKRAKTFNVGGAAHSSAAEKAVYKTLPKQASSRSLGSSSSTDSSHGSTASSRKSSNSSSLSDNSTSGGSSKSEISQDALDEIAAFEKFIEEYFQNCDNNNIAKPKAGRVPFPGAKIKSKVSACSTLSEVLELSI